MIFFLFHSKGFPTKAFFRYWLKFALGFYDLLRKLLRNLFGSCQNLKENQMRIIEVQLFYNFVFRYFSTIFS